MRGKPTTLVVRNNKMGIEKEKKTIWVSIAVRGNRDKALVHLANTRSS